MPGELDELVAAARSRAAAPPSSRPDPSAVFERIDEEATSGLPPSLTAFVDASRSAAREDMGVARTRRIPPLRARGRRPSRRRWVLAIPVAAGLVLAAGLGAHFGSTVFSERDRTPAAEAVYGAQDDGAPESARPRDTEQEGAAERRVPEPRQPPGSTDAASAPPSSHAPSNASPSAAAAGHATALERPARRRSPPNSRASLGQQLAELDAGAQAAWRAGAHAEARRLFEEIVRIGGRHRLVEVAYGELFTLARQTGADERDLWRRYLGSFPTGRHADDARAGLCQATTTEACWRAYLDDFPGGAHGQRARRALGSTPAPGNDQGGSE